MATQRKPKFDGVIDDVRVRVFATRREYEVIYNDDDEQDLTALCNVYPKMGTAEAWAHQGRLDYVDADRPDPS